MDCKKSSFIHVFLERITAGNFEYSFREGKERALCLANRTVIENFTEFMYVCKVDLSDVIESSQMQTNIKIDAW